MKNPFKRGSKRYIKNLGVEYTGEFLEGAGVGMLIDSAIYGYRNQPFYCKVYGFAGCAFYLIGTILQYLAMHEYDITMNKADINAEYSKELADVYRIKAIKLESEAESRE